MLLRSTLRAGLRIHEVPVDWVDDHDSRVDIVRTTHRAEVVVLTLVNLGVSVGRLLALRLWEFRSRLVR